MRTYGDSLLRELTIDVLTELAGKDNMTTVVRTLPFAISNAFYEKLLLHYDLEDLCIHLHLLPQSHKESKSYTIKRGDVLEAYFAAIEKDISRFGQGSGEIYDWLFKVMALRLKSGLPANAGMPNPKTPSIGNIPRTAPQTMLKTDKDISEDCYERSRTENNVDSYQNVVTRPITELKENSIPRSKLCRDLPRKTKAVGFRIWWDNWKAEQTSPEPPISTSTAPQLIRQHTRDSLSVTQLQLHNFRQSVFAKMKTTLRHVCATRVEAQQLPELEAFWIEMKSYFDDRLDKINEVEPTQVTLLYYYRVSLPFSLINSLVICEYSTQG